MSLEVMQPFSEEDPKRVSTRRGGSNCVPSRTAAFSPSPRAAEQIRGVVNTLFVARFAEHVLVVDEPQ